jgi:two-component system nitrogen regulation sensor histidine kinase NtrY
MPSLSLSRHSLANVVEDVVRLYPEARIRLDLGVDLPDVDLDVEQMRRVLINLIENGIEAAGDSGTLTIRTESTEAEVRLLAIDSGPGISVGDRERIFQPHFSTKEDGMGLGLTVVRSIVENHGGRVVVTDAPEGGAQFEIVLPLQDRSPKHPEVDL